MVLFQTPRSVANAIENPSASRRNPVGSLASWLSSNGCTRTSSISNADFALMVVQEDADSTRRSLPIWVPRVAKTTVSGYLDSSVLSPRIWSACSCVSRIAVKFWIDSPCSASACSMRRHEIPASISRRDRKSTRLNSSHVRISYAVFCLKKKKRTSPILHLSKITEPSETYRTLQRTKFHSHISTPTTHAMLPSIHLNNIRY